MRETKQIHTTTNYDLFKFMEGNRSVSEKRANSIGESIDKNGYIFNPIIVNEKMEIINGQGRFTALKKRGMPIDYMVAEGVGVNGCRALNTTMQKWNIFDWVKSYADIGNENYLNLLDLASWHGNYSINSIIKIVAHGNRKSVINGELKLPNAAKIESDALLTYIDKFYNYLKPIPGRLECMISAISFCYKCKAINNKRLFEKFEKRYTSLRPFVNFDGCIEDLESIYNNKVSAREKVYFKAEYDKFKSKEIEDSKE